MTGVLHEVRRNPLMWLLAFVPAVLVGEKAVPEAHRTLFVLSVLAIVPLAALLATPPSPWPCAPATPSAACSTRPWAT